MESGDGPRHPARRARSCFDTREVGGLLLDLSPRDGPFSAISAGHGAIIGPVTMRIDGSLEGIDWVQAKADLAADDFDNGRSPEALRLSFERSQHVAFARDGDRVVGMARLLS